MMTEFLRGLTVRRSGLGRWVRWGGVNHWESTKELVFFEHWASCQFRLGPSAQ
jgi:hypothetical protein